MANIITKQSKGAPLTHAEVDANFTNINNELPTKAGLADNVKFTSRVQVGNTPGTDVGISLGRLGVHNTLGANVFASTVSGAVAMMSSDTTTTSFGSQTNNDVIIRHTNTEVARFTASNLRVSGNLALGVITPQARLHISTTNPLTSRFQNLNTFLDFGQLNTTSQYIQANLTNGSPTNLVLNPNGGNVYFGSNQQILLPENTIRIQPNMYSYSQNFIVVDTELNGLMSWGFNASGQLGDLTLTSSPMPSYVTFADNTTVPPVGVKVKEIHIFGRSVLVLYDNGWVYGMGANNRGQLGLGNTSNMTTLVRLEYFITNNIFVNEIKVSSTSADVTSGSVMFRAGNTLYLSGVSLLGNGTTWTNILTPTPIFTSINLLGFWISTDNAGPNYFINDNGTLRAWGSNQNGSLGINSSSGNIFNITPCIGISGNVIKVVSETGYQTGNAAYYGTTIALTDDGRVWSVGYNGNGQLGQGDLVSKTSFARVITIPETIVDIEGAKITPYTAFYARTNLGKIWAWGWNLYGLVPDGVTTTNRPTPTELPFNYSKIISFSTSPVEQVTYLAALDNSPEPVLVTWGYINGGEFAMAGRTTGAQTIRNPIRVNIPKLYPSEIVKDIFGRATNATSYIFIVTSFGRVFSTGYNVNGELGIPYAIGNRTYRWKHVDLN